MAFKAIVPLDKKTYRKHIIVSLIFQLAFVGLFFVSLKIWSFKTIGLALFFINFVSMFFFFNTRLFKGRVKDLYPEFELSNRFLFFTGLVPLYFLGLVAFLCFKEKSLENRAPSRMFRVRYAALVIVPLVALQALSPSFSYLSASPSLHYIVKSHQDVRTLIEYKESLKSSDFIIENYLEKSNAKLSVTELVLLTTITASTIAKEKGRTVASEEKIKKAQEYFKHGIRLLITTEQILSLSASTRLEVSDYSPVQWLFPSAPTEIMLLQFVETRILDKFKSTLSLKILEMSVRLEKNLEKLPEPERAHYARQLTEIRTKLKNRG
ncbi:MAG: hypothetical protein NDI69_04955 [Bacteriovoracaceae bacterium]|nr:hypothetical protein [Bacteriovoracaceae bacterium]